MGVVSLATRNIWKKRLKLGLVERAKNHGCIRDFKN